MFSEKATKIDEIFTVDLTVTTNRQIDGEDYVNFCGLLRKHELYHIKSVSNDGQFVKKMVSNLIQNKKKWNGILSQTQKDCKRAQ